MGAKIQMGAPKYPATNVMHGYLGPHKQAFPTGYVSKGQPAQNGNPRATKGVVGYDVAKGKMGC